MTLNKKQRQTKRASASKAKQPSAPRPLNPRMLRFIDEYMIDMNGSAAYKRAGYKATGNSAEVNARRMLRSAQVNAEIARRRSESSEKLQITREDALAEAWAIVRADPRELVEYAVSCCRQCHGKDHAHQWVDQAEFERAVEAAYAEHERKASRLKEGDRQPQLHLPSDHGGFGFDPRLKPHADCPACLGAGVGRAIIKDTRTFGRGALALYAGIKETKDGFEVKMHSKLDAMEKVFRHLGMYDLDKPPAANVSVTVGKAAGAEAMKDLGPGDAYLLMVRGGK